LFVTKSMVFTITLVLIPAMNYPYLVSPSMINAKTRLITSQVPGIEVGDDI